MSTATIVNSVSTLGKTIRQSRTLTTDGAVVKDPTLAVAKVGQLTTRTDNDTGTVTMVAGHGFSTGNKISLFWDGGARYGMTATVTVNSVVLDGGGGDNLPVNLTAVTAMVPQTEDFPAPAASLAGLFVSCDVPGWAVFYESDGTTLVKAVYVDGATDGYQWDSGSDAPTPFGSDAAKVKLSHGSSVTAKAVSAVGLVN